MDDEAFRKQWEVTRQQGFHRFVFMRGAKWGAGFAAAYVTGKWMKDDSFDPVHAATAFLVFVVAGWVFSPIAWIATSAPSSDALRPCSTSIATLLLSVIAGLQRSCATR